MLAVFGRDHHTEESNLELSPIFGDWSGGGGCELTIGALGRPCASKAGRQLRPG
jgi:hypothetical protein